jgi:MFS transporter, DHA1 family, multidrug resistance protein
MSVLFATVLIICILSGAEVDLFTPSFPELQRVFNLTPFMVQLTLSANFVSYCICSLFAGTLGDRYNRRYVMLGSLSIFVFGSFFCVLAVNFPMLIVGRFLQGIGMAGPSVLAFIVIADEYPLEKQPAMLGMLNGIVTLAMAFAPVLGSYVNLYFNWRGNFVLLLILGVLSLLASYFVMPNKEGNPQVSLAPKAYWPLLTSKKMMCFVLGICFLAVPYWTFIGLAPILYMEDMGVDLKHFGFYQGAIAGIFSIVSISSPKLLDWFGQKKCLYYSLLFYLLGTVGMLIITLLDTKSPMIITGTMLFYAAAVVFPINILYPISLEVLEYSKSRAAALITGVRLLLTAIVLEVISFFYVGKFYPLGLGMVLSTAIALIFLWQIFKRGWANLDITSIK